MRTMPSSTQNTVALLASWILVPPQRPFTRFFVLNNGARILQLVNNGRRGCVQIWALSMSRSLASKSYQTHRVLELWTILEPNVG